jgi:hypothetical protein
MKIGQFGRAEIAALVTETLAVAGIDVVLVGGSCVCIYTNERFASFDLDFIDLTYARKRAIAAALADIGFRPRGSTRYFAHNDSPWVLEFPTAPLAVGHEQITSSQVAELLTTVGTIKLLSPTDCIKDRLLNYYAYQDQQCLEQAKDVACLHPVNWSSLKKWHAGEGYADRFHAFRRQVVSSQKK